MTKRQRKEATKVKAPRGRMKSFTFKAILPCNKPYGTCTSNTEGCEVMERMVHLLALVLIRLPRDSILPVRIEIPCIPINTQKFNEFKQTLFRDFGIDTILRILRSATDQDMSSRENK